MGYLQIFFDYKLSIKYCNMKIHKPFFLVAYIQINIYYELKISTFFFLIKIYKNWF